MNLFKHISELQIEELEVKAFWLFIIASCVLAAMVVDLIAGLKKAHEKGEVRTSYGLRRTVDKALRYFSLLFLCFLMDIVTHLVIQTPYFTIVSGVYLVFTEVVSWFEKADRKERSNAYVLGELLRNKDDLAKGIAEIVTKKIKENETNT